MDMPALWMPTACSDTAQRRWLAVRQRGSEWGCIPVPPQGPIGGHSIGTPPLQHMYINHKKAVQGLLFYVAHAAYGSCAISIGGSSILVAWILSMILPSMSTTSNSQLSQTTLSVSEGSLPVNSISMPLRVW